MTLLSDDLFNKSYDIMKQYWELSLEKIDVFKTYKKYVCVDRSLEQMRKGICL